jgi:[protein-PII] uridylyltransferase
VLALNQLDVRAAKVGVEGERATAVFAVRPRFGRAPVAEILADGVRAALEGTLPLAERLRQREVDYRQQGALAVPARLSWHDGEAPGAGTGIVEVRAGDRAGLLYRLTAALAAEGLDVTSARVETLGGDAVDSFYVCNPSGAPIDDDQRRRVDAALAAATGAGHEATVEGKRDTPG